MLDPGLIAELERLARRTGRPTAHVIREAMERYVAEQRGLATERLPAFIGIGTGPGGVSRRDEEILRREMPSTLLAYPKR
ncbi:MAG TPA: ribbon-helix-helix protein, CopG family [Candidatus Limnocylindria bacterium]|nr:ribbon-helix-helix protein, CopG family [Candidatus Limnocylindria bacterium]